MLQAVGRVDLPVKLLVVGLVIKVTLNYTLCGIPEINILGAGTGTVVCYAFGTAWYLVVYARTKGAISLATALGWCVVPFLIPDAVKIALAVLLRGRLKRHIPA